MSAVPRARSSALTLAGVVGALFLAVVVVLNLGCAPGLFLRADVFSGVVMGGLASLALFVAGGLGTPTARVLAQLPAGILAGMWLQPGTGVLFAMSVALLAVLGGPRAIPARLAGTVLFAAALTASYFASYSIAATVPSEAIRCP